MRKTTSSKSLYFLMEIMIVLIFFAISAAICLQFIVGAHEKSLHGKQLRFAMQEATSIVEVMQATHELIPSYEVKDEETTYAIEIQSEQGDYNTTHGKVIISNGEESLLVLPFAYGGKQP